MSLTEIGAHPRILQNSSGLRRKPPALVDFSSGPRDHQGSSGMGESDGKWTSIVGAALIRNILRTLENQGGCCPGDSTTTVQWSIWAKSSVPARLAAFLVARCGRRRVTADLVFTAGYSWDPGSNIPSNKSSGIERQSIDFSDHEHHHLKYLK